MVAPKLDCLAVLLDAGAKGDQRARRHGRTKAALLLTESDSYNNIDCLELLCKYGACLTGLQGANGYTIHYVVQYYRSDTLRWLLGKSFDLEARNEPGHTPLLHFLDCDTGKNPDILRMLLDNQPDLHTTCNLGEGLCHLMARYGSLAFLQVFQSRTDLAKLDVDHRSSCALASRQKSIPGKTAMELAEWRRDSQSEWSLDSQMDLDPDPQAYFAAFKAWLDASRAPPVERSSNIVEISGEMSGGTSVEDGERIETVLPLGQIPVADGELRQRVPGSFPD